MQDVTDRLPQDHRDRANAHETPLLTWVWRDYVRPHWRGILFAMFLMAIEGVMLGAISYIVRPMFDNVFIAKDRGAIYWVAAALGGIFLLRAFANFGNRVVMNAVGLGIVTAMQRDMVRHLLTLDSAYFQTNAPGTLIERVRGDTTVANQIWRQVLGTAWRDVIGVLALLAVAISVDWKWTLIAVAGVPLFLGPIAVMQRYVRKKTYNARVAAARLSTRLDEIFHGVNTIKLNNSERHESGKFEGEVDRYLRQEMKARMGSAGVPSAMDIVAGIGFAGVVVYGGNEIIDGDKTVGEFMSFFTALGLLFEPLRKIANVSAAWQAARASLERIQQVFQVAPTILSPQDAMAVAEPRSADIAFEDVVVVYGDEPALRGVTFTARAGETTALVGASGAGKSTLFNVLARLVDAQSGRITVGGVATTELDLADLRSLFSVVTQEAPMFDESLRDNIVLSTPGVDDDRMAEALKTAHLTEFVAGLPEGLDAPAGPRGSKLSGGQRQRVAIARAVLRDAPVLLLDEATSALDAESELRVQSALDQLSEGRTTLVIAHRLSTIRRADRIVVMDKGRVVDQGPHEELLARGGVYARLYQLQFSET